ncbi:MAG: glutamyl-tRNA reductase [Actinomycetota bacterium]|nr:glutamyl-tRNA reductase [Actinomycetota bacterium]
MSVVVVGLSHRTVALDLLERMTVAPDRLPKALGDLVAREFVNEAVILSTCHRVEIYAVAERFHGAVQDIRHFLSELAFVAPEDFSDDLYTYYDDAAAAHLFVVAAGLDSVMLGESQILGQVRDAWDRARAEGAAGSRLSALFRHALEVGKRARTESAISRGVTSMPQAAVAMATDRLGSLAGKRIVVVGAGEMSEGMASAVEPAATADVVVANRTRERAEALAERVGGRAVPLDRLPDALRQADVLLTSTGSPTVVVDEGALAEVVDARGGRPLLIVDLGMPRDVDPAVGRLAGVTLLDLADLRAFVDAGVDERRNEVVRVRGIVADEVARYVSHTAARTVAPTITALRQQAEQVRTAELDRYRSRLEGLDDRQRQAVDALTHSLLAKLLHEPTVRLKDAAGSAQGQRLADSLRELFGL